MTLQQFLLLRRIVVDHTRVGGRIENFSAFVISQEVHSLVNVLVETMHTCESL